MNLEGSYRRFHGRSPRRARTVQFNVPEGLVVLGEAVAIEYRCDKLNGGGDGRKAIYRHEFNKGALLVADQNMKSQLYILGGKIRVTDAGIVH